MESERPQVVDYASPARPASSAGRWALLFGILAALQVPFIVLATKAIQGTWNPIMGRLIACAFAAIPVFFLCAVVSGIRGLFFSRSRYATRAIVGLTLAAAAVLGGLIALGWIGSGYR